MGRVGIELVLSKGHCCPALYSCLANRGFFDVSKLEGFREIESNLQGHPDMTKVPGVDMSTGSLGQGLSCAVGMAIAGKMDKKDYRVYCNIRRWRNRRRTNLGSSNVSF